MASKSLNQAMRRNLRNKLLAKRFSAEEEEIQKREAETALKQLHGQPSRKEHAGGLGMKTFENYPGGKAAAVAEAKLHREQDRLASGFFYRNGTENWKGCSIGCFAKTEYDPYEVWAEMMGTPPWLPRLIDRIFEFLPRDERVNWHVDVIEAIPEDVVLAPMGPLIAARCLRRCADYIGDGDEPWRVECRNAVADSADILETGRWLTEDESSRAAGAAWAAGAAGAAGAARAAWAARAAEIRAQRDDLLELLGNAEEPN